MSNNENGKSKFITGLIVGGVIVGSLTYSYFKSNKSKSENKINEDNSSIDEDDELDYIIKSLKSKMLFYSDNKERIKILDPEDSDEYDGKDFIYMRSNPDYIEVTLAFNDTLYKSNRNSENSDPMLYCIRCLLDEISRTFRYSIKPTGFYFEINGKNEVEVDYIELRSYPYLKGYRYIDIRFYDKKTRAELDLITEFISKFDLESDNELTISNVLVSKSDESRLSLFKPNRVVFDYLKR